MKNLTSTLAALLVTATLAGAHAPYVTFFYHDPAGSVLVRDVMVTTENTGTYYCALGWFGTSGYAGLQKTTGVTGNDGKTFYKHLHFSLWDTPTHQPIPMIWKRPEVVVDGFGGEGTGVKSYWPFDWKVGARYTIALKLWNSATNQTAWGMWFKDQENHRWYRTATWGYPQGGLKIPAGTYSFLQDYLGNDLPRGMWVGPTWKKDADGNCVAVTAATMAERDGLTAWNAGVAGKSFFVNTGGTTTNKIASKAKLTAAFAARPVLTPQTPKFTAENKSGSAWFHWTVDDAKSPPFAHQIEIFTNAAMTGAPVATCGGIDPSAVEDTMTNVSLAAGKYFVRFTLTDIFDQTSVTHTTLKMRNLPLPEKNRLSMRGG